MKCICNTLSLALVDDLGEIKATGGVDGQGYAHPAAAQR